MVDQVLENKLYNVRPGDTLLQIADIAKVDYSQLLRQNPQIKNPNLIRVGDTIILPGKISRQSLIMKSSEKIFPGSIPPWFKVAQHEIGVAERTTGSNPRILEYLATTGLSDADKGTDATAWCSAFVNWCLKMAGEKGTNSAWALSWEKWGKVIAEPRLGAVVVFSRKSENVNGGHVGFLMEDLGNSVKVLGGNQGNAVTESIYPKNAKKGPYFYKLVGYRWPA